MNELVVAMVEPAIAGLKLRQLRSPLERRAVRYPRARTSESEEDALWFALL